MRKWEIRRNRDSPLTSPQLEFHVRPDRELGGLNASFCSFVL